MHSLVIRYRGAGTPGTAPQVEHVQRLLPKRGHTMRGCLGRSLTHGFPSVGHPPSQVVHHTGRYVGGQVGRVVAQEFEIGLAG